MIQPLRIKLMSSHVVTSDNTGVDGDNRMVPVPVEIIVLDSGEFSGVPVGYIRYVTRPEPFEGMKAYPWQVCLRHINTDEYTHVSTFHNFEAALHAAMGVAYRYQSQLLNQ